MGFVDDLLKQADHLANKDQKKPQQANLRRAVSSAYYAVFHELIAFAAAEVVGAAEEKQPLGGRLRRICAHANIKLAAGWFTGQLPQVLVSVRQAASINGPFDPDLVSVCRMVIDLQEQRHVADYDLDQIISRRQVLNSCLPDAKQAITLLRQLAQQRAHDTRVFLLGCVLGKDLLKNP
jgi:hypothetical protein